MPRIGFDVIQALQKRISGFIQGENAVLVGYVAGDRIVQPQKTLILARHKLITQVSGSPVECISSFLKEIGVTDNLELKDYIILVRAAGVEGSDFIMGDQIQINLETSGAPIFKQFYEPPSTKYYPEMIFQLNADCDGLSADSVNYIALETHTFVIYWEIYRLTDGIGQFSL